MATKVVSGQRIPINVWVPPVYSPVYKTEVVSNGTTYDLTDIIISGEYTDGVTETIGAFDFTISNALQEYTDLFSPYDTLNIYLDYATSATTLRFSGKIEKISKSNETLRISGRSGAVQVLGITVTKSYPNDDVLNGYTNEILLDLVSKYCNYITTTNVDTTTATDTTIAVNWNNKTFWECVQELTSRSGYDCFIDQDGDMNYFVSGTRSNTTEAVVHESNLIETGDFSPDSSVVRNRVIVYGAVVEEQQIIWTSEDSDSIATYKVKELIINDSNIKTVAQAQARADYELSLNKDAPIVGEVTSLGLPTLKPGEKVRISDPMNGIAPDFYTIQKFTHKFSNDEPMQTVLTVQKEISTLPKILKKRITFESEAIDKTNPNEMRYSILETFAQDTGYHQTPAKTEIVDGVLKLKTGETTGQWFSDTTEADANATYAELRVKGGALSGTTYKIYADGGATPQTIIPNTLYPLSPPGTLIRLKIIINSADTQVDSYAILYK